MFKKKFESMITLQLDNPNEDYKKGKRVGKYIVTANAIYRPDNKYLPKEGITGHSLDKGSVHVTGCCIGVVPVDRIVFAAEDKPFIFEFDSKKQVLKALGILGLEVRE